MSGWIREWRRVHHSSLDDIAGSRTRGNESEGHLSLIRSPEWLDSDESDAGDEQLVKAQQVSDDERWWAEVDRAIATDSIADDFFAHSPAVIDLDPPAPSGACPCGRLPHLCTCEYYRQQRLREQQRQQHIGPQIAEDVQQFGYLQFGGSATREHRGDAAAGEATSHHGQKSHAVELTAGTSR